MNDYYMSEGYLINKLACVIAILNTNKDMDEEMKQGYINRKEELEAQLGLVVK